MNKPKSYDKEIVTTPKNIEYMVQAVKGSLEKRETENLFQCSNDTDLFKCLWSTPSALDILSLEEEFQKKSEVLSKSAREKGNEYFKKKSYISALQEYNTSIVQAPYKCHEEIQKDKANGITDESTELALAFGNRSATLFQLGKYKECLLDIQRALKLNYPSGSAYKLFHRRGCCESKLKRFVNARNSFEEALKILNEKDIDVDDKVKNSWRKTIEKCLAELPATESEVSEDDGIEMTFDSNSLSIPDLKSGINETVKEASDLVEFKKDARNQDCAFAKNDVNIGDVLAVEKPYASILFSSRLKKQKCYNCFSNLPLNPLPCCNCTTVLFCNESCRSSSPYHKFECNFLALFDEGTCADVGHLAIRILMTFGVGRVLDHMKSREKTDATNGEVKEEGENLSGNEHPAKDLSQDEDVCHSIFELEVGGARKPTPVNNDEIVPLMELPFFSCFLVKLLHMTGFLKLPSNIVTKYFSPKDHSKLDAIPEEIETSDDDDTDVKSEEDLFLIGGFMVRCLRIIRKYGKFIREAKKFGDDADKLTSTILGIGLYPNAVSKVQHSCDPSADIVHYNNVAVIRSIRKLNQGDEISISFGPLFHEMKLEPRRKLLWKANSLMCCCVACYNKWPVLEEMFDELPGYKCEKCRSILTATDKMEGKFLQCPVCKHKQNLEEIVEKLRQSFDNYAMAMNDAMSGDYEGALPRLSDHLQLIQTHIRQPWPDLVASQTAVKLCYRLMANRAES